MGVCVCVCVYARVSKSLLIFNALKTSTNQKTDEKHYT